VPRVEKRELRREQILEGLFEAMAREGTRGASISEIAESAGIARGALHYYFSSKEEIRLSLMRHLGERYVRGLDAYLTRILDEGGAPDRAVVALIRYHFGGDDEVTSRLLTVWIDFWGSAPSDDALSEVVLSVQEAARQLCWRVVVACRPEVDTDNDGARRARAAALLALIEGALLQWRIARTREPFDKDALVRALTDAARAQLAAIPLPAPSARARAEGARSTTMEHADAAR